MSLILVFLKSITQFLVFLKNPKVKLSGTHVTIFIRCEHVLYWDVILHMILPNAYTL